MSEGHTRRRLAAILVADVVGYSQLMAADETGTLAALKARRGEILNPLVQRHHGRIFKLTGDGALIEFASAVNAVQCAIELQQGMARVNESEDEGRRIVLRIGVNLGDVMVEGSDLFGDGINIAARLEGLADPGGICISEDAYRHVRGKLKLDIEDLGDRALKNISEPVRAYRILGTPLVAHKPGPAPGKPASTRPAIAILPFANMSEDADKQYLSDGITEDIITELARYNSLLVIARNSAFQFRGSAIDLQAIRKKLGVRFVVEGSVRKIASRIRITAQLIDAVTEAHLWADRFDRDIEHVFEVQDEIARKVASIVEGKIAAASVEQLRRKPTSDWVAYDYFLQGRDHVNQSRMAEAEPCFARAIELDPNYVHAHALRAIALATDYGSLEPLRNRDLALASAQRAISLDENDAWAHQALGYILLERNEFELAGQHFDRAIALNPNDVSVAGERANFLVYAGRHEESLHAIEATMQRDPHLPPWIWGVRGMALFHLGRYKDAIASFLKRSDNSPWCLLGLAAAYAEDHQRDRARAEIEKLLANYPHASLTHFRPFMNYVDPAHHAQFTGALRKAGLPE